MLSPSIDCDESTAPLDTALHQQLLRLNERRLQPSIDDRDWRTSLAGEVEHRILEGRFLESCRDEVVTEAREAPVGEHAFLRWFTALRETGPGQHDPLFDWIATTATRQEVCWFLRQEVAGEAGFEDLVALTQLKLPVRAKLELARNYWDEMGRGIESAMHGPMLARLDEALHLDHAIEPVAEALALANLLAGLAFNRRYAFHAIGALGVVELTAPSRAVLVNRGLKRLGIGADVRQYFALHATLDLKHSAAWNEEVIAPLVRDLPECRTAIAEGALMRLHAGQRCFARYRAELGVSGR